MASGRLTTHVLDTANGRPAAGMTIELYRLDGESATLVRAQRTNADGRTDEPMLAGEEFTPGQYELRFHVGPYFAAGAMPFLDMVPVRFAIADAGAHYHVPLLASPYGYTTYRGS